MEKKKYALVVKVPSFITVRGFFLSWCCLFNWNYQASENITDILMLLMFLQETVKRMVLCYIYLNGLLD